MLFFCRLFLFFFSFYLFDYALFQQFVDFPVNCFFQSYRNSPIWLSNWFHAFINRNVNDKSFDCSKLFLLLNLIYAFADFHHFKRHTCFRIQSSFVFKLCHQNNFSYTAIVFTCLVSNQHFAIIFDNDKFSYAAIEFCFNERFKGAQRG